MKIIAEIANAHQGDVAEAIWLGEAALSAEADFIKFQIYFADELLIETHSRFQHFANQQFDDNEWRSIFNSFKDRNKLVAADIFGTHALEVALKNDVELIKVHSSDLVNFKLLDAINQAELPQIILSTGGATGIEIREALAQLNLVDKITLMHGFQAYPTSITDMDMSRISWLSQHFGDRCDIGFQDHIAGGSELSYLLPAAALGAGASIIEKHITRNRSAQGVDYYSSLEPCEFTKFTSQMRAIERSFRSNPLTMSVDELKYRSMVIKQPTLRRAYKKGEKINSEDIVYLRTEHLTANSMSPVSLERRPIKENIESEKVLTSDKLIFKNVACIIIRNKSTRLPDKAISPICGEIPLEHLIKRVKRSSLIDDLVLCTSDQPFDDVIEEVGREHNLKIVRGSELNVLDRLIKVIDLTKADNILRITGDDILFCAEQVDAALQSHMQINADYTDMKSMPGGTEAEILSARTLQLINSSIRSGDETEYLTNYIMRNELFFSMNSFEYAEGKYKDIRLTLDTSADKRRLEYIFRKLKNKGIISDYTFDDLIGIITSGSLPDVPKDFKVKSPDIDYRLYLKTSR